MVRRKRNHDEISILHSHGVITNTREIFLHNSVAEAEDPGVDYRMFNTFIKNLRLLESESDAPIIVHQYSIGGDWEAGMAIYDAIAHSPCKILFLCHGVASSMGSVIPQAVYGTGLRVSYPSSYWLIHEGSISLEGTFKQAEAYAKFCRKINQTTYDIYSSVCSTGNYFEEKSFAQIKQFLKNKLNSQEDWYLDAYESVHYGFADGVFGEEGFTSIGEMLDEIQSN